MRLNGGTLFLVWVRGSNAIPGANNPHTGGLGRKIDTVREGDIPGHRRDGPSRVGLLPGGKPFSGPGRWGESLPGAWHTAMAQAGWWLAKWGVRVPGPPGSRGGYHPPPPGL